MIVVSLYILVYYHLSASNDFNKADNVILLFLNDMNCHHQKLTSVSHEVDPDHIILQVDENICDLY